MPIILSIDKWGRVIKVDGSSIKSILGTSFPVQQ